MLPARHRLRRAADFRATLRHGRSARGNLVQVHVLLPSSAPAAQPVQVGFVVGRAVGPSVDRHRVQRRLRHLMAQRLAQLPEGCSVVVRAQPAAAVASSHDLGVDLDRALHRAARSTRGDAALPATRGERP